jgi:hypothetical protein
VGPCTAWEDGVEKQQIGGWAAASQTVLGDAIAGDHPQFAGNPKSRRLSVSGPSVGDGNELSSDDPFFSISSAPGQEDVAL